MAKKKLTKRELTRSRSLVLKLTSISTVLDGVAEGVGEPTTDVRGAIDMLRDVAGDTVFKKLVHGGVKVLRKSVARLKDALKSGAVAEGDSDEMAEIADEVDDVRRVLAKERGEVVARRRDVASGRETRALGRFLKKRGYRKNVRGSWVKEVAPAKYLVVSFKTN